MKVRDFTRFITHYAGEAASIGNVLSAIVSTLPLPSKTRADIGSVIDNLTDLPERLAKAANEIDNSNPVTIKRADIEAAVAKVLPKLLDEAVAKWALENERDKKANAKGDDNGKA